MSPLEMRVKTENDADNTDINDYSNVLMTTDLSLDKEDQLNDEK